MKSAGKDPLGPLEKRANVALEATEYRDELSKVCRERFGTDCAPGAEEGKVDETGKNYCADVYQATPGNGTTPNLINLNKPLGKVCVAAKPNENFPARVKQSIFSDPPNWATKPALDTGNLDHAETQVAGDFDELEAETAQDELPAEAKKFLTFANGDGAVALQIFERTKTAVNSLKKQLGDKKVASLESEVQKKINETGGEFPELAIRKKVYQDYLNGK